MAWGQESGRTTTRTPKEQDPFRAGGSSWGLSYPGLSASLLLTAVAFTQSCSYGVFLACMITGFKVIELSSSTD